MLAVLLDLVEGLVGLLGEFLKIGALVGDDDGPHRRAQRNIHIRPHEGLGGFQKHFVNLLCLLRDKGLVAHVAAEYNELVAADSPGHVGSTDNTAQDFAEPDEHLVAHGVAVEVVDEFEAVQVDHHEHAVLLGADFREGLLDECLVEEARHGVGLKDGTQAADLFGVLNLPHGVVDTPEQDFGLEGLADVVDSAGGQSEALAFLMLVGRDEYNRNHPVVLVVQNPL